MSDIAAVHDRENTPAKRTEAVTSARLPREIKQQGDAILRSIGSSPTELVNAAYRYVIATHELPGPRSLCEKERRVLALTDDQHAALAKRRSRATVKVPAAYWAGKSDDELLVEAMVGKYEALS